MAADIEKRPSSMTVDGRAKLFSFGGEPWLTPIVASVYVIQSLDNQQLSKAFDSDQCDSSLGNVLLIDRCLLGKPREPFRTRPEL